MRCPGENGTESENSILKSRRTEGGNYDREEVWKFEVSERKYRKNPLQEKLSDLQEGGLRVFGR
ncbi:hypothetical protein DPMN_059996 [Dreissena polymorpha]|uniref:Uncharacterized protein n=1 Tax=Dreissena polymorpha TaxID=45954 RepID=A0A9D4HFH4_DREPO|nr:hypothetical protein DPMN_059996 [Dreissena polymorpha]